MHNSTPLINGNTSHSNFSSTSQIRLSHIKPHPIETKGPLFLQQINVSLNIPKHDNELPDYNLSPVAISGEQRSIRSLAYVSAGNLEKPNLDQSVHSSIGRVSILIRKNTMQQSIDKVTVASNHKDSNTAGVDVFARQEQERREKKYMKIEKFLDLKSVNVYMVLITMYALFGEDFGTLVTSKKVDTVFDTLTLICTISFLIEMTLGFISRKEYRWSFFFWLDLISTLSMLIDLSFIPSDAIDAQADATQIARAGRVSKIGARAGRVVRIIRLVRIAKLFKQVKETDKIIRSNSQSIQSLTNLVDNIVKMKRQAGASAREGRPNSQIERARSLTTPITPATPNKDNNHLDPKDLFDEDRSLLAHAPRRLSQFATLGKGSAVSGELSALKRREPTKMLVASLTEMNAKQVLKESNAGRDNPSLPKESRVGKTLSELTTKRVIIVVLLVLLIVPLMSADSWSEKENSYVYDVECLKHAYLQQSLRPEEIDFYIFDVINRHKSTNTPIIYFQTPNGTVVYQTDPVYTDIRSLEVDIVEFDDDFPLLIVVVDISTSAKVTAGTNICRTLFICLVLGFGSLLFSKDANDLVLRPLERMVEKVNRIAVSPLSVKRENLMDETQKKNETAVLENAITKIGTLLALGFGDAGAQIIAQNITQGGDMNPMLSGEKIMAIFGFCDIRNFTDATEVLQEDVMVFVNSIAEIVHDKIDKYGGSANKNIGDAFLLVWKFPNSEVEEMDDELQLKNTDLVKGLSDLSLFSFLKIFAKINQSHVLRKYRNNPKLLERLPNYRVKMGFGLHVGWAIEGAIGSEFKIDASYLSPNVNIASRLEAATKQYGVPLLISNDLFVLLSDEVQRFCRKIDVVTVKGSQVPLALYTVDIDSAELRDKGASKRSKKDRIKRHELKKQKMMEMIWEGKLSTHLLFEKDKDLKIAMKKGFSAETRKVWEEGLEAYLDGDWLKARLMLDRYLVLREGDGPALTLLRFMGSLDYKRPHDWRGFRELTEK